MGKEKFVPRLCGGTFFTLLLKARMDTRKSQVYLFKALMRVYDPAISGVYIDLLPTPASQFRNCNQGYSCDYIKMGETTTRRAFEERFQKNYEELLKETEQLCEDFLTKGRYSKSETILKDILELIWFDDSIDSEEKLYIRYGGAGVLKKDLLELDQLYFESALLGIWHFICTVKTDNSVGRDTIVHWGKEPYMRKTALFDNINITYDRPSEVDEEDEVIDEGSAVSVESEVINEEMGKESDTKSVNQVMKAGKVFHQTANTIIQWLCSTYIEKGVKACKGIRIDDTELQGLNITEQTVVEKVIQNGKKHYCYTSKADSDCGIRNSASSTETENGSVLPSVNRPRRTVIKL